MVSNSIVSDKKYGLSSAELLSALALSLEESDFRNKRVLILPPDYTRFHSGAGQITNMYYHLCTDLGCEVDIMPALGTHAPMTEHEILDMYGDIPTERFFVHNWRNDVVCLGEVPHDFVADISEGLVDESIDVEVNRRLLDSSYDLILSVGQVVPHEVVGMANRNKNIFVGCGGSSMINKSHMLGAFYGMERIMGRDHTPVRKVFDYAEEHFLMNVPIVYIMTCTTRDDSPQSCEQGIGKGICLHGLFIGRERSRFEEAVALASRLNFIRVDKPFETCVVYLEPSEFKSTWLGNKSIYRTRMAMKDGGRLIVLAPGITRFGEDDDIDVLIRRYGYTGREHILQLVKEKEDLRCNLSAAAHLIHGSSDGRFTITYCTKALTEAEVRGVGFDYMPYDEAARLYSPDTSVDGLNRIVADDGSVREFFYISNPALGLWSV